MKKIIAAVLSVSILMLLTSCKRKDDNDILNTALERFTYENVELTNNESSIFGIDDNNILYIPNADTNVKINIETYG